MIKGTAFLILMTLFSLCTFAIALAQDRQHPVLVRFPRGRTTAILEGKIIHTSHIYTLRARAGQTMTLHITSAKGIAYFSLAKSNSEEFIGGAVGVKDWSGVLPVSGAYDVSVGIERESSSESYTLEVSIR